MSDIDPIPFAAYAGRPRSTQQSFAGSNLGQSPHAVVAFTRQELSAILAVYGRLMAADECRDYAMDFGRDKAVFSIFRRASEVPIYRIEKAPKLARKQGTYAVVSATGLILKRGHELARVLDALGKVVRMVR